MVVDCIGLDLGRTAIKAVRFRRRLSGREELTFMGQKLPPAGALPTDDERVTAGLRAFVERHKPAGSILVTSLPCQDLFVRTLRLPFSDPKKLAQVVPFEVETLLPLPLDEVAIDCLPLPAAGRRRETDDGGTHVLVAAAPKATLTHHLGLLAEAGLEPEAVNIDALALYALARHLSRHGHRLHPDCAIIDVGASKTTLCLLHHGHPWMLRTVALGGRALTQALAARYGLTLAEAERRKRASSAQHLEPWLAPLVKEIHFTLHAYQATTQTRIRQCVLSGGGSTLKELPDYLSRVLEVPAVVHSGALQADCPPAFSVALGLAMQPKVPRPAARLGLALSHPAINFKQGTERARAAAISGRELRVAAAGLLVLCLLGLADLWVHVTMKETQVRQVKAALQGQFHERFGLDAPPGEEVNQARARLDGLRKTIASLENGQARVLPGLTELSRRLPKDIPVKIHSLTQEEHSLHLEAEAGSFESVERIKQALLASDQLTDVSLSGTRVGASPTQVLFRISLRVTAP
jgi:general secretion pathway protein L